MDDIFRAGANNADDLARIGLTSDNELAKMGINSADELGKLENITFGYQEICCDFEFVVLTTGGNIASYWANKEFNSDADKYYIYLGIEFYCRDYNDYSKITPIHSNV